MAQAPPQSSLSQLLAFLNPAPALDRGMAYMGWGPQQGAPFPNNGQPAPTQPSFSRDMQSFGIGIPQGAPNWNAPVPPPQLPPTAQGMPNPYAAGMTQTYAEANPHQNVLAMMAQLSPKDRADFMAKYGRYFLAPGTAAYGNQPGGTRREAGAYYARTAPSTTARDTDPAGP